MTEYDGRSSLVIPSLSPPGHEGLLLDVTPARAQWRYAGMRAFHLSQGAHLSRNTGSNEECIVVLGGRCGLRAGDMVWDEVGGRETVFDGPPHAVYLPPGTGYMLEATSPTLEIAIGFAAARTDLPPRLIAPDHVKVSTRGYGSMERTIHDILMEDQPAASLLITEVLTPGGHWSSYPPHKHDTENLPTEAYLEEIYYHRLRRTDGFAVQRVYTRDGTLDATMAVHDGDVVLVPRGYHPVSAAPGFDLYYLNVMSGPVRQWRVTMDPDIEWLLR